MWRSILLDNTLAVPLLKIALQAGHITLHTPETESEETQVKELESFIRSSRRNVSPLTYCLLADTVYLDGSIASSVVYEDKNAAPEDIRSSPLIHEISQDASFINITNSMDGHNFLLLEKTFRDTAVAAQLIASLEPMIWRSFKRGGYDISRADLRCALDMIAIDPTLTQLNRTVDDAVRLKLFGNMQRLLGLSGQVEVAKDLIALCSTTITKGQVAAQRMMEVERLNAVFPVDHLSFGRNRSADRAKRFGQFKSEEIIAATRLFLREVQYWPIITDFDDVLRLRQHRDFKEFRDHLRRWTAALVLGDTKEEVAIRREIQSLNKSLARAAKCADIGGLVTYLGLPLIIVDMFAGPWFGTPLTITGFGLQAYSDWVKKANRWMVIGRP